MTADPDIPAGVGIVVIGRNEGERLRRSLATIAGGPQPIVYVDSGSGDDSVALARSFGVDVVELPHGARFTAARARNAGADRLAEIAPALRYVQFVDGDCELQLGWLATAARVLDADATLAAVCGRRREIRPEASRYNRLCDIEWDTPVGLARTVGGDALMRLSAFHAVGGFDPVLIAGEEPDLCDRLLRRGHRIRRLDHEMTRHDAAITRFRQWWQRARRSGYAMAHGRVSRGDYRREIASTVLWSLPAAWPLWPLLWWRVMRRKGALYATFTTIGKLPHLQGLIDFHVRRRGTLIEYK
jgi:GT2 family glycosyltransferase